MTNFRTAKYTLKGMGIDDPNSSLGQPADGTVEGISAITRDTITGKLAIVVKNGRQYTVSYPTAEKILIEGNGMTQSIQLDSQGRFVSTT